MDPPMSPPPYHDKGTDDANIIPNRFVTFTVFIIHNLRKLGSVIIKTAQKH